MTGDAFPQLLRLALRLEQTEPAPSIGALPMAYGYIRTPEREPAYADACGDLLGRWATTAGYKIGAIFRDLGIGSSQLIRPGFTGLLDVLGMADTATVVVVEKRQLSRKPADAKALSAAIRRTGAELRVLADELGPLP